jgi:hypothetical protein
MVVLDGLVWGTSEVHLVVVVQERILADQGPYEHHLEAQGKLVVILQLVVAVLSASYEIYLV